ncbi:MAG: M24 family metallopeptidase [Cyanobacteria bacterium HKST-UBA04]|nr:M24 family metallopeptidase [Cyanobacteria bacterium HKST-UBA04]
MAKRGSDGIAPPNTDALTYKQRRDGLLEGLRLHKLDGYVIPPDDEHLNEYVLADQQRIQWLTGFHGENALVLATRSEVTLFVDGRFHIQVDQEVDDRLFKVAKLGLPTAPSFAGLLGQAAKKGRVFRLGYDPATMAMARLKGYQAQAAETGATITWVPVAQNLVDRLWRHKFQGPCQKVLSLTKGLTGLTVADKLAQIRAVMHEAGSDCLPVVRLDEIAWLFNLRGADIAYNPVVRAFALLTPRKAQLFIDAAKLGTSVREALAKQGVSIFPYEAFYTTLAKQVQPAAAKTAKTAKTVKGAKTVWVDEDGLTDKVFHLLKPRQAAEQLLLKPSPIYRLKSLKNPTEQAGMRWANLQSSRVLIKHLCWAEAQVAAGKRLTEADLKGHLEATYRAAPHFFDFSFPSIIGLGPNSAIIHYGNTDRETKSKQGDWYLLDSGAHFKGTKAGTTDTTRTTVLGKANGRQITHYTLVLQAHLACAMATVPKATTGDRLDAITRAPMWAAQLDYRHGTGHGVGAFLNVHEGPVGIHGKCRLPLEPGLVLSIEPGYYEGGWGGIRIENLGLVCEVSQSGIESADSAWLGFEQLTFVPYARKLVKTALLTPAERGWVDAYHRQIWQHFQNDPGLDRAEKRWLSAQCAPLT